MISLTTAQNALKNVYLDVVSEQLNFHVDPIFAMIKQSSADVYGKNIIKLVPYGINGGVGSGTEDGALPPCKETHYVNFSSTLKNLFGTIEITDKAIRASANDEGAFVNLLSAEMESLLSASKFNLERMFYGDSTGSLANITEISNTSKYFVADNVAPFETGMLLDFYNNGVLDANMTGVRVVTVDRTNKKVVLDKVSTNFTTANLSKYKCYVQGSKDNELTGLGEIFGSSTTLYGLNRADYKALMPYSATQGASTTLSESFIQECLDDVELCSGYQPQIMVASPDAYYSLVKLIMSYTKNVEAVNLKCGVTSVAYNGIPLTRNKYVSPKTVLMLNPDLFTLHQLCDWEWLTSNNGAILTQKEGYPTYSATLVKYADLICNRPNAQGKITLV